MIPKSSATAYFYRLRRARARPGRRPELWRGGSSRRRRPPAVVVRGAARRASRGPARTCGRGPRRRRGRPVHHGLLGPVPVAELEVSASVVRPGRSVSLATLPCTTWPATGRWRTPRRGCSRAPTRGRCRPDLPRSTGRRTGARSDQPRRLESRLSRRGRVALDHRRCRPPRPGRRLDAATRAARRRAHVAAPAPAGVRRLGVRGERDARRTRVGLPQHRADRSRPPRAGRRVDLLDAATTLGSGSVGVADLHGVRRGGAGREVRAGAARAASIATGPRCRSAPCRRSPLHGVVGGRGLLQREAGQRQAVLLPDLERAVGSAAVTSSAAARRASSPTV